jgi:hypothetical protein
MAVQGVSMIFADWRKANPKVARRYAAMMSDLHGIDVDRWKLICHFYLNCCVLCGRHMVHYYRLSIDHIDGNRYNKDIDNFQPLCSPCNSSKGQTDKDYRWDKGKILLEWLPVMRDKFKILEHANKNRMSMIDLERMNVAPQGVSQNGRRPRKKKSKVKQLGFDFE